MTHAVQFLIRRRIGGNRRNGVSSQAGMTLIEVMISMAVFLVVSSGVAATMVMGLHTSASSRQNTSAKGVAQQQLEEMKARPFYVPYSTNPNVGTTAAVDLLSKYFPNVNTAHVADAQGWTGWYTQSGGDAYYTTLSPADSQGITRTIVTRFVDNQDNIIVPPADYNASVSGSDLPPSQLVKVTITTSMASNSGSHYQLDSMISGTVDSSCAHSSNSHVDVFGGTLKIVTGAAEPYSDFLDGSLGDAHATTGFGCTPSPQASGTGGKSEIFGGDTAVGACAAVSGPPDGQQSAGPIDVTSTTWPTPGFYDSTAKASVESELHEAEAEGQSSVGTETLRLQQVDGASTDTLSGYKSWDFVNPTITVTGGQVTNNEQIKAELSQDDGVTQGHGSANYQQVNILPLQAIDTDTPSALQGIVFVRTFSASGSSSADGKPGDIINSLTYSAVIGMFNPEKAANCTGDDCYDLYTAIGPQNPIQTAIDLSQSQYSLQHALLSEWFSASAGDINNAMASSSDGTTASVSIDALLKITGQFGSEVRRSNSDASVIVVNPQGLEQVWLGSVDISILQHE